MLLSTIKEVIDMKEEEKNEMQIDTSTHQKTDSNAVFNLKGFSEKQ